MTDHYIKANWPLGDKVHALMTCRSGGLSELPYCSNNLGIYVGDEQAQANRLQLESNLCLPSSPVWLKQVHGVDCVVADDVTNETEADAVCTVTTGKVLAIQTADCLPVVFADRQGKTIAAAHAGWRGLFGGVLENTLAAMPVDPSVISCWMGAAIGPCCFEVGDEVREAFTSFCPEDGEAFVPAGEGKWLADLYQLARDRLLRAGVADVYGGGYCTACDTDRFFSYRRDASVTGRMATLIWMPIR